MNRMMTTVVVVALALVIALPSAAQPGTSLLGEAIAATDWQSASFRHVFRLHGTEQEVVESGEVTFGDLPQMRWTYRSPEEKVFVFDGRTSWLYIPADRQVSVHELTDSERAQLPFLVLEDAETAGRDFRIESSRKSGTIRLSLTPKNDSPIRSLILHLEPQSKRIRALEYMDVEGNHTRFEFEQFRRASRDPGQFRFQAPAGVESVEY